MNDEMDEKIRKYEKSVDVSDMLQYFGYAMEIEIHTILIHPFYAAF